MPSGTAVRSVRAAVAGLLLHFFRLDDLHELGIARVGLGVENVNAGRAHARHHQVTSLHVRMRRVRAQTGTARVPAEMVQLVARIRHVHATDDRAVRLRRRVEIHDGHRIGAIIRRWIQQSNVCQLLGRRFHGHFAEG